MAVASSTPKCGVKKAKPCSNPAVYEVADEDGKLMLLCGRHAGNLAGYLLTVSGEDALTHSGLTLTRLEAGE